MLDAPEMTAASLSRTKQAREKRIKLGGSFRIPGNSTAGAEPDGSAIAPITKPQPKRTQVKRGHWRGDCRGCECSAVAEIAATEQINKSYVSRILRLALLAPDIVETILEGWSDQVPMLEQLERPLPASWEEQRSHLS